MKTLAPIFQLHFLPGEPNINLNKNISFTRKPIYLLVGIYSFWGLNFILCFQLIFPVYIAYSRFVSSVSAN